MTYVNAATYPIDLANGRVLAPGEKVADLKKSEHNKRLVAAGQLVKVPKKEGESK